MANHSEELLKGLALTDWTVVTPQPEEGYALSFTSPTYVDAMKYTYLEYDIRTHAQASVYTSWTSVQGEFFKGPVLDGVSEGPAQRCYIRDHPHWQGAVKEIVLTSHGQFTVNSFRLFSERDLDAAEKFAWPGQFSLTPRRRVVAPNEPVEARLVVPNRLLRLLGKNHVVFSMEDANAEVLVEKQVDGRTPLEPWGATDFLSGALVGRLDSPCKLRARVIGDSIPDILEDTVSVTPMPDGSYPIFSHPYHCVGGFSLLRSENLWHIFYTLSPADSLQRPDNIRAFVEIGHAVSHDLRSWKMQDSVMPVARGDTESARVFSPTVVEANGEFWMFYTAVNESGAEHIAAAFSKDLWAWVPAGDDPAYRPNSAWSDWRENRPSICRSPGLSRYGDTWVMHVCSRMSDGRGCVAAVVSSNLTHWADAGPILTSRNLPDSPVFFHRGGNCLLFTDGAGAFSGDNPLRGWRTVADMRPAGWTNWEFVEMDGTVYAMAARSISKGNYIQAFPLSCGTGEKGELTIDGTGMVEAA